MSTAKVITFGKIQVVRLPKEFRLNRREVEIFRKGDQIVLREKPEDLPHPGDFFGAFPDGEMIEDTDDS